MMIVKNLDKPNLLKLSHIYTSRIGNAKWYNLLL